MTSLILNIESKEELLIIKSLVKRLGINSKTLSAEEQEDYFLLQAMLAERKKDYVSKETVFKKLETWK